MDEVGVDRTSGGGLPDAIRLPEPPSPAGPHDDLLDDAGVGVLRQAPDGTVLAVNRTARALLGDIAPGNVLHSVPNAFRTSSELTEAPDGSVASVTTYLLGPHGAVVGATGARRDGLAAMLTTIVDATPVGVCITREDGTYEHVNAAYERLYGYTEEELLGRHFTMVVPEERRAPLSELHDRFIADGAEVRGEWEVVTRDGAPRTILADACRVVGADGRYRKVTFVVDITDRKATEAQLARANARLAHLALHDPLTGLANRRRTFEALGAAVESARRHRTALAVAVLDLDHFKAVNDAHGHQAGDRVLVAFAELVRSQIRGADTAGRIGGEEFLLVMPSTDLSRALVILDRLRGVCAARLATPSGDPVTMSVGVAVLREGERPEDLLGRADRAVYRAKAQGRDQVEVADADEGPPER